MNWVLLICTVKRHHGHIEEKKKKQFESKFNALNVLLKTRDSTFL